MGLKSWENRSRLGKVLMITVVKMSEGYRDQDCIYNLSKNKRHSARSLADVNLHNVQKSLAQGRSWPSAFCLRHNIHDLAICALSDGSGLIFTR